MKELGQPHGIDLNELIVSVSNRWYVLVVLMIIGGIIGLLLTNMFSPIYESSATFSVTIDYTRTGALTDIQEDQAMRGVGSVIFSDIVVNPLLEELRVLDETFTERDFFEGAALDRTE